VLAGKTFENDRPCAGTVLFRPLGTTDKATAVSKLDVDDPEILALLPSVRLSNLPLATPSAMIVLPCAAVKEPLWMLRPARTTRFSLLLAAAVGNALVAVIVLRTAQPEAHAQTQVPSDTPASFEVISIQTIDPAVLSVRQPGAPPLAGMSDVYFLRAGGSFRAPAISARNLVAAAFGVKSWQVVSGAAWLATARFAINAKTSTEVSRETLVVQAPALMRALLSDRFRLRAHMERRPFPVFALTMARQDQRLGPQLRRTNVDCDARRPDPSRPPSRAERPTCGLNRWPGGMIAGAITMEELASALTGAVGSEQIVVNRTNLAGRFDVDLAWSSEPLRASGSDAAPGAAPPDDGLMLWTALQEQLGLRLLLRPEPIDAVVVDHIERPSPN
jgi:uncharacterized protein (TIGR03435 family)